MNTCASRSPGQANAHSINEGPHAAAVVDAQGRICGCGVAAEDLFLASQSRLMGRRISEFIVGILFEGNSPGDNERQLLRLCADTHWQRFDAIDSRGQIFGVEIHVSRKMIEEQDVFIVSLRQPGATSWP